MVLLGLPGGGVQELLAGGADGIEKDLGHDV
jgi:hypothetical protein